jgi:stage V sporulation protein G
MVEITEVRVSLRDDDKLKAFVSITLNDSFVIRGLKIIHGNSGLFVAMPSRKRPDGEHQDLAHPINDATRKYLTDTVMAVYQRELATNSGNPGSSSARPTEHSERLR